MDGLVDDDKLHDKQQVVMEGVVGVVVVVMASIIRVILYLYALFVVARTLC